MLNSKQKTNKISSKEEMSHFTGTKRHRKKRRSNKIMIKPKNSVRLLTNSMRPK